MNPILKKSFPYLFFLFGILVLIYMDNIYIAIASFIISIVMILERIWPSVNDGLNNHG